MNDACHQKLDSGIYCTIATYVFPLDENWDTVDSMEDLNIQTKLYDAMAYMTTGCQRCFS